MNLHFDVIVHNVSEDDHKSSLAKIIHQGAIIMSAISDFATKQAAFQDRIDAAVTGLTADVAELNDEILKLQNTSGAITPEDQALLDGIQARSGAVADKLDALDGLTAPVPPTV